MSTHISNITAHLRDDKVTVHNAAGRFPVLQLGSALTLHVEQTPTETLQNLVDALCEVIDARDAAADVAAQVAAEDGVRWIGVPVQRESVAA